MELLFMISAAKRASCKSVTAVIPYLGYSRQDKKSKPRVPISSADVAKLIEAMGVDRVISLDLHTSQIQGFFGPTVPVDNLTTRDEGIRQILNNNMIENLDNCTIVSPDSNGVPRARAFQLALIKQSANKNIQLAMMIKRRKKPTKEDKTELVGDIKGRECIIVDDLIDTGETLAKASKLLKNKGAKKIIIYATHGIFSGKAMDNFKNDPNIDAVIVTNSTKLVNIPPKIKQISIAALLAEAIRRVHQKEPLSGLQ